MGNHWIAVLPAWTVGYSRHRNAAGSRCRSAFLRCSMGDQSIRRPLFWHLDLADVDGMALVGCRIDHRIRGAGRNSILSEDEIH